MNLPAICVEMGLRLVEGRGITDTLVLAKNYGKRHDNVVRDIDNHLAASSDMRRRNWFKETRYIDEQGKPRRMYEMVRNGLTFLVHKWTGPEPTKFTLRYMDAFDAMEEALANRAPSELVEFTQAVYALAESNNRRADANDRRDDEQDRRLDGHDAKFSEFESKIVISGPQQWFRRNVDKLEKASRDKVRSVRQRKAEKYKLTIEEMEIRGWFLDAMQRDLLAVYRGMFDRWGVHINELSDLSLDHRDPMGSWDYPSNYDWIHKQSNNRKGCRSAAEYSIYLKNEVVQLDLWGNPAV